MFCRSSSSHELADAEPAPPMPRESTLLCDPPEALKNDEPPSDLMELAADLPVSGPPAPRRALPPAPTGAAVGDPTPTLDVNVVAEAGEEVSNLEAAAEFGEDGCCIARPSRRVGGPPPPPPAVPAVRPTRPARLTPLSRDAAKLLSYREAASEKPASDLPATEKAPGERAPSSPPQPVRVGVMPDRSWESPMSFLAAPTGTMADPEPAAVPALTPVRPELALCPRNCGPNGLLTGEERNRDAAMETWDMADSLVGEANA